MSRLIVFIIHCRCSHHSVHNTTPQVPWSPHRIIELATNLCEVFTITEKSSTRVFYIPWFVKASQRFVPSYSRWRSTVYMASWPGQELSWPEIHLGFAEKLYNIFFFPVLIFTLRITHCWAVVCRGLAAGCWWWLLVSECWLHWALSPAGRCGGWSHSPPPDLQPGSLQSPEDRTSAAAGPGCSGSTCHWEVMMMMMMMMMMIAMMVPASS